VTIIILRIGYRIFPLSLFFSLYTSSTIRFVVVAILVAGVTTFSSATVASNDAADDKAAALNIQTQEHHRSLKRKGNPDAAKKFGSWYIENVSPCDYFPGTTACTPSSAPPPPPSTPTTSTITDFQLACNNNGQQQAVEVSLFGEQSGQDAVCICDPVNSLIGCAYGDPVHDATFSIQEYYAWTFDRITGKFLTVDICHLCEDGACLNGNTAAFDSSCKSMGFFGLQQPSSCAVTFESTLPNYCQPYLDCAVCVTANGFYGVAPTLTGCFSVIDGSACLGAPFLYNPFIALRASAMQAEQESRSAAASGSNVGGIVGGVLSVLLFVVIGGGIYYFLHEGVPEKCPRLPCCKKKEEGTHYVNRDAKTMSEHPDDTDTDQPDQERGEE
jgi:hypothetical protein